MRNVTIPRDAWELDRLPEHLHGHVPGARRARPRGRPRHGSGEAPARAGAEGPRGTGDRRCGHRGDRADHLDARDPPARDRRPAWAARRHRLSGPRRPRHVGGRAGLPDGGRARPGAPARRPAAPAAGDPVAGPHGRPEPRQRRAAGPVANPARLPRHAARRLRDGVGGRADHRRGRPGMGRGVVREAACRHPGEAGVDDGARARLRPCRADGLAPGAGAHRRAHRAGAGRGPSRPHRAGERPGRARGSSPRRAPPGSATSPATCRPPSCGSTSCAPTRPATRSGRPRSGRSPTSTRPSWRRCPRASSRRRSCRRSAG